MRTLSIAGGFHVRLTDEGEGNPLLYLHGLDGHPGDPPALRDLATGRRVVAPEFPGYGESSGIDQIDDVLDMALYHRRLVETLGLEQVDLIGHSLGGMFAAEVAAICPQIVRRLILVDPFGLWIDETPVPDLFTLGNRQLRAALWHEPEGHVAQQELTRMSDGVSGGAAVITRAGNLSTAGKFLWPIPDRGLRKRLPFVKAPTLVIVGASDGLVGEAYGKEFVRGIPNARLEVIREAGHSPMLEQPEAWLRAVREFLS